MLSDARKTARAVANICRRRKLDGSRYYPKAEVEDVLPVFLLRVLPGESFANLDPSFRRLFNDFFARIGLAGDGPDATEFEEKLRRYWTTNPPNAELIGELEALLPDEPGIAEAGLRRFQRFSDAGRDLVPEAANPAKSIPRGAAVQLALSRWDDE